MTGGTGPGGVTQQVTLASASGSLQNPNPVQQQVNMQYVGSSISVTSLTSNVQNKPSSSSQSYVMAGGPGGQSLIVSGATMIPATATLGPASLVATGPHHERANIYVPPAAQATLTKVVAEESYMMQRASLQGQGVVHDSADDGHAVSIHVSGGGMGLQHEGGSADSHQSGQSEQRLKVEDALNYLDQVKYKFGNQPQVYNDFLDIMKEFKSQSIDTPGVISRVSNLFRGHPELIVGFNTFLPPGYKIEVQVHDQGSQVSYRVDGVTNYIVSNLPSGNISSSVLPSHSIQQSGSSAPIIQHTGNSLPVRTISSHQSHSGVASGGYGASGLSGVISNGNLSPAAAPGSLAAVGPNYEPDPPSSFTHSFSSPFVQNAFPSLQSQPVQFNHAINYVNKIKNRFHGQPERYKQFLDILHTYQKEQKNFKDGVPVKLSEQEVYSQVAKIFENQDDLLAEFGQFLPESSHQPIIDIKPNIESINLNMKNPTKASQRDYLAPPVPPPATRQTHTQSAPKRSSNAPTHTVAKKAKMSSAYQGVSFTEASKWGSLQDFAFFDKVRMVLKNSTVYDNFRMKEEEWRESQKNFNRVWKDQVERFYLKSLDHQGITFKQADMRMLRSKTLVSEIETIYDERHEQDMGDPDCPPLSGPHLTFQYGDRAMLDEACNLLLHHVRRLSGIQNEDKRKIKQLLKHFVPDLFKHTRMELSDDEVEAGSDDHDDRAKSPAEYQQNGGRNGNKRAVAKRGNAKAKKDDGDDGKGDSRPDESRRTAYKRALQKQAESIRAPRRPGTPPPKETKSANTNTKQSGPNKTKIKKEPEEPETFRVIQVPNAGDILVERLGRMFERATKMILEEEEARGLHSKSIPPSVALRMRQESIDAVNYFPMFIENVKNLLDGNIEPGIYEDSMREMFGIHAYITYTMDKVVTNAVRQLQTLVSDDSCVKLSDLFIHAQKNGGAGGLCDTAEDRAGAEITYQKQAEKIDPEENCYKIVIYHKSFRMTVELLEGANIEEKETATQTIKWTAYMDSYTTHTVTGTDNTLHTLVKPMYLNRNVRMGQHVFRGKSYPPELAKMFFGTVDEPEKGPSPLHVPDKVRMRQKSEAGSPKCILSQTLDPISTEEAEDIEKQLERNAKKLEQAQKEKELDGSPSTPAAADSSPSAPDGTPSQPKKYLATISPVTPEEANRLEKQLELNAKRREDAAKAQKSPYIIKEGLQCMFQPNCYKMIYVANTENYFYLRGSLKKAKETHKSVSNRMNEAFGKWLEASATEDHITRCEDWLLSAKNSETKIVSSNDISLPPYRPFNKYVVKK